MMTKPQIQLHSSRALRWGYITLGLVSTGIGILGAFLPVLPTTCFMLVALWAFSKGSPRLHKWLWEHKIFGATLRRWQDHRCIPVSAKVAAVLSMSGSMTYLLIFSSVGTLGLSLAGGFMAISSFIVLRLPSTPRGRAEDCAKPLAAAEAEAELSDSKSAAAPKLSES